MALDITQFSKDGRPPTGAASHPATAWWLEEGDDRARAVSSALEFMRNHQTMRLTQWVISSRLYGNLSLVGRAGVTFSRVAAQQPWLKERISWNCVQSASDTVTSKMVKNKPRALFLTNGGDYKIQRQAKKLTQFVEGVFYENEAYKHGGQAFLDSTIWGDGITHVYSQDGRVKHERVIASELWVDDLDGFYGDPRSMHRVTNIDRAVLLAKADEWLQNEPEKRRKEVFQAIMDAPRANPDSTSDFLADTVTVAASWHLPSCEGANDGVYAISIQDCELFSCEWKRDHFPFARMVWCPRMYGYWSQGLAEQLQNIQLEINTLLQTIKQSFWKGGTFRVFLPTGSRVVKEHITNQIGSVVSYSGQQAPVVVTPPLVQPEIFEHLNSLWQKAFEQAGVSLLSAASQKPAGLNAAVALREFNDIQTDRFMKIGQAYEDYFMQLAKLDIETIRELADAHGGHYKVKVPIRGNVVKEIDWSEVNLRDEQFVMKCFPVSSLPQDPAGRLETLTEWVQAGWVSWREAKRLMDFPDLEALDSLQNASEEMLLDAIEHMIDDPKYVYVPENLDDLALAQELALEYIQRGKLQNMEEPILEKLRRFLAQVQAMQQQAQQAAQAQQQQQALQAAQLQAMARGRPEGAGAQGGPPPAAAGAAGPPPGPAIAQPLPPPVSQILPMIGRAH